MISHIQRNVQHARTFSDKVFQKVAWEWNFFAETYELRLLEKILIIQVNKLFLTFSRFTFLNPVQNVDERRKNLWYGCLTMRVFAVNEKIVPQLCIKCIVRESCESDTPNDFSVGKFFNYLIIGGFLILLEFCFMHVLLLGAL